jgi:hypothetical protein
MLRKIRTFIGADPTTRVYIVKAVALVALYRTILETTSFRRAVRVSRRLSKGGPGEFEDPMTPIRLARAVKVASGNLLKDRRPCLPQALALYTLYNRRGIDSTIKIGVMKDDAGKLSAHAWIEKDNLIMIGWLPDLGNFTPLPDLKLEAV